MAMSNRAFWSNVLILAGTGFVVYFAVGLSMVNSRSGGYWQRREMATQAPPGDRDGCRWHCGWSADPPVCGRPIEVKVCGGWSRGDTGDRLLPPRVASPAGEAPRWFVEGRAA